MEATGVKTLANALNTVSDVCSSDSVLNAILCVRSAVPTTYNPEP